MKTPLLDQVRKVLTRTIKRISVPSNAFVILLSFTNLTAFAQDNNMRSSNVTEAVRVSEEQINFTEYSVARTEEHFASNELRELNRKANLLLNELRNLLKDAEKEAKFRMDIGPAVISKVGILCPGVELKQLLMGIDRSKEILILDQEEAKSFIYHVSATINYISL